MSVAVLVVRPNREQHGLATSNAFFADYRDVVLIAKLYVCRRQRGKQRALVVPLLYSHGSFVRQDALHLIAIANDLQTVALLEDHFLANDSVAHNMDNRERLRFTVLETINSAFVVRGLHCACHFHEPVVGGNFICRQTRCSRDEAAQRNADCREFLSVARRH